MLACAASEIQALQRWHSFHNGSDNDQERNLGLEANLLSKFGITTPVFVECQPLPRAYETPMLRSNSA